MFIRILYVLALIVYSLAVMAVVAYPAPPTIYQEKSVYHVVDLDDLMNYSLLFDGKKVFLECKVYRVERRKGSVTKYYVFDATKDTSAVITSQTSLKLQKDSRIMLRGVWQHTEDGGKIGNVSMVLR